MPVYGLAEQAANIIRAEYNGVALAQPSSVTPPTATSTGAHPSSTSSDNNKSGAAHTSVSTATAALVAVAAVFALL